MSEAGKSQKKKLFSAMALVLFTVVIVIVAVTTRAKSSSASTNMKTTAMTTAKANTSSTDDSSSTVDYKDGTYTASGSYYSPGGEESIKVTLTLSNGSVIASNVVSGANDPTASSYQSIFISNYKKYVVGKKITSIKLSNVSGSSLTSQGFNDALKQIEQEATA